MAKNIHRLTASRILLIFAVCLFVVSLGALQVRFKREQLEWVEYVSGLGDTDHYDPDGFIGENDFFGPNLKFDGRPEGLYRRNFKAQGRRDGEMLSLGRDVTDSYTVYTPCDREADRLQPLPEGERRFFLKAADDLYVEFGEQKYWPEGQGEEGSP